jgi:hypothetical protein
VGAKFFRILDSVFLLLLGVISFGPLAGAVAVLIASLLLPISLRQSILFFGLPVAGLVVVLIAFNWRAYLSGFALKQADAGAAARRPIVHITYRRRWAVVIGVTVVSTVLFVATSVKRHSEEEKCRRAVLTNRHITQDQCVLMVDKYGEDAALKMVALKIR